MLPKLDNRPQYSEQAKISYFQKWPISEVLVAYIPFKACFTLLTVTELVFDQN